MTDTPQVAKEPAMNSIERVRRDLGELESWRYEAVTALRDALARLDQEDHEHC